MTTPDDARDRKWPKKGGYSGAFPISVLGPPPKGPCGCSAVTAKAAKSRKKKAS